MATANRESPATPTHWGGLPLRIRALFVTGTLRTGGWLAEALAADSASEVMLEEIVGMAAGTAKLRDELFDIVLISHEPQELDALELSQALRAGGMDSPILILGSRAALDAEADAFESGADAYVCVGSTTTRALLWTAARAIERCQLVQENRRLALAQRKRLDHEHQEAGRLLAEQRGLIAELQGLPIGNDPQSGGVAEVPFTSGIMAQVSSVPQAPQNLVAHYADLLRAYVVMGSGNLSAQMRALAGLLVEASVTPQQAMMVHLEVLEGLIGGLGSRSARHVMTRADLVVLEVMVHLAEGYRRKWHDAANPPRQLELPGFDAGR